MLNRDGLPDENEPFFWRVGVGIMYAEMPFGANVRPPLLSEWESERVESFRSPRRRNQWLAGRALAKALVRERLQLTGIIDIREGSSGEPLIYRNGLPMPDVWLSIDYHDDRIASVVADRPVALDMRRTDAQIEPVARKLVTRSEHRVVRKSFDRNELIYGVSWAVKEAAVRASRASDNVSLSQVKIKGDMSVVVGDVPLYTLAVRVVRGMIVAIVGRPLLEEQPRTRIVWDESPDPDVPTRIVSAVERSIAKARRVADGRARWQRLRWL